MSPDPFTTDMDSFPASVLQAQAKERAGTQVLGRRGPEPPPASARGIAWPLLSYTLPTTDAQLRTLIGGIYSDVNASINRANFNLNDH